MSRHDDETFPKSVNTSKGVFVQNRSVYFRSAAAVLIPAVVWLVGQSKWPAVFWQLGVEKSAAQWMVVAAVLLFFLEARYLTTLWGLLCAGGRADLFQARRMKPAAVARRRRYRFRAAAVLFSSSAALVSAEVLFRVFDIRPPSPPRSFHEDFLAVDNTLNRWGFREKWDDPPPPDGRLRLAFLGDSIVYGDNVEPNRTFCRLVERSLSKDVSRGVVTFNLGIRGTSPGWQLEKLLPIRDLLNADIVVHVVYPNDLGIEMHHRLDEIYRLRDNQVWCGEWSYLLRYAERQIRFWLAWRRTIEYFRGGTDTKERAAAWAKFKSDVRACKAAVEQTGATYALVLFPWLVRLEEDLLTEVHQTMGEFADELAVPFLDLREAYSGRNAETLRVSLANEHPNEFAHELAAERLRRFLVEKVLPKFDSSARP